VARGSRSDGEPPGGPSRILRPELGGRAAVAAAGAMVSRCRRPPGVVLSPPPHRPDGPTVMTVITVPTLRPAATPVMATPSGMMTPPPPPLLEKRTTQDRRLTTLTVTTRMTTRTMTSGGGTRNSTCPPPCCHRLSATSSAMPLPRPACCCRASRCPGSMSDTATP
jgi:hypothetical protein